MLAGFSKYDVGTRVRLKNITDKEDLDLNGRTGTLVQPFKNFLAIRDVGVLLDTDSFNSPEPVVVHLNEFEVVRS